MAETNLSPVRGSRPIAPCVHNLGRRPRISVHIHHAGCHPPHHSYFKRPRRLNRKKPSWLANQLKDSLVRPGSLKRKSPRQTSPRWRFGVGGARFTDPEIHFQLASLSLTASGEPNQEDAGSAATDLQGHYHVEKWGRHVHYATVLVWKEPPSFWTVLRSEWRSTELPRSASSEGGALAKL